MHNQSDTDSLSALQRCGSSSPARLASTTTASSQGGGGQHLFPSWSETGSSGGVGQGESRGVVELLE